MRWFRCQKKWSTGKSQQLTDSVTVIGLAKYSEALKLGIFTLTRIIPPLLEENDICGVCSQAPGPTSLGYKP